jgi:hypothetical protein
MNFYLSDNTIQYLETLSANAEMNKSQFLRFILKKEFSEYSRQQRLESAAASRMAAAV